MACRSISTPVGAEGINATDRHDIVIAPIDRMAQAIVELATDEEGARAIAAHGRDLVLSQYDWTSIGNTCTELLRSLVLI